MTPGTRLRPSARDPTRLSLRALRSVYSERQDVLRWLSDAEPGTVFSSDTDETWLRCYAGFAWQTFEERLREALSREEGPTSFGPTSRSLVSKGRGADGSPEVTRHVFSPLTVEDDDRIVARHRELPPWSSWLDAARSLLPENQPNF